MNIYSKKSWVKYVFETFLSIYPSLKEENNLNFFYGEKPCENSLFILDGKKCKKTLKYKNKNIPIYHANTSKKLVGKIIATYANGNSAISYDEKNNIIYVNADLIKTAFFLLSRIHENETELDHLNRFQAKYSLLDDVTVPLVNEYFRLLHELVIKIINKEGKTDINSTYYWPNNAPYAVCLTHDVDNVYKWWPKKILSFVFKEGKISELIHSLGKGEYWNFDKILDIESNYGFKSTFFFLTAKKDLKPRYKLSKLSKVIKKLEINGWEVGLHTGFKSFNDSSKLYIEKKKLEKILGKKVEGLRNHYLRMDIPKTWSIQSEIGFIYDTTLGFRETVGFRSGYCFPHYLYDFANEKKLDIIELPMTIMDSALLLSEKPKIEFKNILENVKRFNGLLVLNWHQCSFDKKDYSDRLEMYKYILKILKKDNAYVDTCKNIIEWWGKKTP